MGSGMRRQTMALLGAVILGGGLLIAQPPPDVPAYRRADGVGDPPPVPGVAQPADDPPAAKGADAQGEVLGRGPIHEGYAQPGATTPTPAPVVPKKPPEPINEVPPDQKPEGDNVVWIPGYWGWDDDRNDYLWVSGFWRVIPPGRKWVPGYWAEADGGWRWVAGLWADARQPQMPYLSPPPANLDNGPSVPAPDEGHSYVPGMWMPNDDSWLWRPGFWCAPQPGWVYTPPRYCWTPNGCLFVSGFWDRPLETRGMLFAPMAFAPGVWMTPGFVFTPRFCVGVNGMLGSLWIGGGGGCYAFGDFYGARYARMGFQPWLAFGPRHADPLYGYYRGMNRGNPAWRAGLVNTYNARLRGTAALPARTLAAASRPGATSVVQPLSSYRSDSLRLSRVPGVDATRRTAQASAYRQASVARQATETTRPGMTGRPSALSLAKVPDLSTGRPAAVRSSSLSPREQGIDRSFSTRPPSGSMMRPGGDPSGVPPSARGVERTNPDRRSLSTAPGDAIRERSRPDDRPDRISPYALSPADLRRSRGNNAPSSAPPPTIRGARPDVGLPSPDRSMRSRNDDDDAPLRISPRTGTPGRSFTPAPARPVPSAPRLTMPAPSLPRTVPSPAPAPTTPRYAAPATPRFSAPSAPRGGMAPRGMAAPGRAGGAARR